MRKFCLVKSNILFIPQPAKRLNFFDSHGTQIRHNFCPKLLVDSTEMWDKGTKKLLLTYFSSDFVNKFPLKVNPATLKKKFLK